MNLTTTSQRYGFLPELLGRFSRIVPFNALGETELRNILSQQVLSIWSDEMSLHEIDMSVETCNFGRGIWRVIGGLHCFLTSHKPIEDRKTMLSDGIRHRSEHFLFDISMDKLHSFQSLRHL